jgi:hypothetical protein
MRGLDNVRGEFSLDRARLQYQKGHHPCWRTGPDRR